MSNLTKWEFNPPIADQTLLDYFAGQALNGWISALSPEQEWRASEAAEVAYYIAKAMLEERNKRLTSK